MADNTRRVDMQRLYRLLGVKGVGLILLGIVASLLLAAAEFHFALLIEVFLYSLGILDKVSERNHLAQFVANMSVNVSLLMCLMGIIRGVTYATVLVIPNLVDSLVVLRLRRAGLKKALFGSGGKPIQAAEISALFSESIPKTARCIESLSATLPHVSLAILLMGVLVWTSPISGLVALCGLGCAGGLITYLQRIVRLQSRRQIEPYEQLSRGIQRIAANAVMLKIYNVAVLEFSKLSDFNQQNVKSNAVARTLGISLTVISSTVGIMIIAGLVYVHTKLLKQPGIDLLMLIYLMVRLVQTLNTCVSGWGYMSAFSPYLKEGLELVEGLKEEPQPPEPAANAVEQQLVAPSIEVHALSYKYPGHDRQVVRDLTFSVPPGSQFGIVGQSGVGKSTLLSLILGILEPDKGSVTIGGRRSSVDLFQRDVRVGYVGAESGVFSASIKENLDYGQVRTYTVAEYERVLADVGLNRLAQGTEAILGIKVLESGAGLSAGERQRLSLARALLRQPSLLVLDEVTANLDHRSEADVVDILGKLKGKSTILIVTHRYQLLKHADLVLEYGGEPKVVKDFHAKMVS